MAIQTGGTTRIGNTGQLQNITSVDATTATAIGNAGVGGAMSLIHSYTIPSGGVSSYAYTFPTGYDTFIVEAKYILGINNTITYPTLKLSNSTGGIFGTNGYHGSMMESNNNALRHNYFGDNAFYGYGNSNATGSSIYAYVRYPRVTNVFTHGITYGSNYDGKVTVVRSNRVAADDNRDFQLSTSLNTFAPGGVIRLWGIT
tara:strand:- start:15477 stop:16079 length:603 start_codon:yes stop_codon:yes gene_type:complete